MIKITVLMKANIAAACREEYRGKYVIFSSILQYLVDVVKKLLSFYLKKLGLHSSKIE